MSMNWKYVLSFGVSALLFVILFTQVDLDKVISIIEGASLPLVLICVALTVLNMLFKVVRWKFFLDVYTLKVKKIDVVSTYLASLFLGNIVPARIGEISRPYFLKKRYKTSFFHLLPVILVERFLDMTALLIVAMLFLLFFSFFVSELLKIAMILTFLIMFLALAIMLKKPWMKKLTSSVFHLLSMKKHLRKIDGMIDKFYAGLAKMRSVNFAPILLMTLASMLCEVFILYFAALSLGLSLDLAVAFGFLSLSLLGGTISSLPGGLGSAEAILFTLFVLLGVNASMALSAALLTRFLSYFMAVLFSFPFFIREVKHK
jgi:hypothetical protein